MYMMAGYSREKLAKWQCNQLNELIMHLSISCPTPGGPHTRSGDLTSLQMYLDHYFTIEEVYAIYEIINLAHFNIQNLLAAELYHRPLQL